MGIYTNKLTYMQDIEDKTKTSSSAWCGYGMERNNYTETNYIMWKLYWGSCENNYTDMCIVWLFSHAYYFGSKADHKAYNFDYSSVQKPQ